MHSSEIGIYQSAQRWQRRAAYEKPFWSSSIPVEERNMAANNYFGFTHSSTQYGYV